MPQGFSSAQFEPLRTVGFAVIGANYIPLGSALSSPTRIISINNGLNEDVFLSLDGVTDHLRLVGTGFELWDLCSNSSGNDYPVFPIGQRFYVKHTGIAPVSGDIWIHALYTT